MVSVLDYILALVYKNTGSCFCHPGSGLSKPFRLYGALEAQLVKCWPTDLVDRVQSSLKMTSCCPDMTEILLKRM